MAAATGGGTGISPHAIVSKKADIPPDCTIGPFTIVHDNVRLGEGTTIASHCIIGQPTPLADGRRLEIGAGSVIRSHAVFYEGSRFGPQLITGHQVTVREKIEAGKNLVIGNMSDLRDQSRIGDHVRLQSQVGIGQFARLGDFVWIFPYVTLTNDPHPPSNVSRGAIVDDYAAVATTCTLLPGMRVGARSLVSAMTLVNKDVPPDTVVGGVPMRVLCKTSDILHKEDGKPAYPWIRHFHRGFPPEVVAEWRKQFEGS